MGRSVTMNQSFPAFAVHNGRAYQAVKCMVLSSCELGDSEVTYTVPKSVLSFAGWTRQIRSTLDGSIACCSGLGAANADWMAEGTANPNDPKQMHWKGEIKAGWALIAGILCLPQSRKTRRRRTTSREAKQSRFEASLQQ